MCSNTLKRNKLEADGSLKENKSACFKNSKGSGTYLIWFVISEKSIAVVVHACNDAPKSLSKQGIRKNRVPQFPVLSALKLTSCVPAIFKGISKHSWMKIL